MKAVTPPAEIYENYSGRYSRRQRIAMLVEAFIVYALALFFIWVFWWHESPVHNMTIATSGLLGLLVFIFFISPRIHHDTGADWGLGSIVDYFQHLFRKNRSRKPDQPINAIHRFFAILWFLVVNLTLVVVVILLYDQLSPEAVNWLNDLIQNFRLEEGLGISITQNFVLGAVIVAIFLIEFILFSLFRYDNFWKAFKSFSHMLIFCLPSYLIVLIIYIYGAGAGTLSYEGNIFVFSDFLIGWAGYIIWGSIQQLIFLGYFNTRLRKAMLGYEWKWAKRAPVLCALINASFFSIIHIPGLLALFAFIGGAFFAWYFQKKGNQNIFVAGILHGLFGTLLGNYLKFIPFTVGPEQIVL